MQDLFEEGVDLFNRAAWYEAHEVWEDLWRATEGGDRIFYQGLIQIAVGLHHISRGNTRGGRRVLDRGLLKLAGYPPEYHGIESHRLQQDLEDATSRRPLPVVLIRRIASTR